MTDERKLARYFRSFTSAQTRAELIAALAGATLLSWFVLIVFSSRVAFQSGPLNALLLLAPVFVIACLTVRPAGFPGFRSFANEPVLARREQSHKAAAAVLLVLVAVATWGLNLLALGIGLAVVQTLAALYVFFVKSASVDPAERAEREHS